MRRGFLLTVLLLAIGVAALWPTVLSLVGYWEDIHNLSYTHGYLVAAICVWLVWRARPELDRAALRPWWPALLATLLLGALWYLAWISGIEVGHQLLLPPILLAAVAAALGLRAASAVAFAVGYLYFAIPGWSLVNGQLQALTTFGVSLMIRATTVPAYVEGNFVHIPSGTFEIAGGCSGLHFFIVALAIGALYGELDRDRLRNRLLIVGLAAVMAVLMNWVRVYAIILNGHLTNMQGFLVQVDHYYFGWALFAVLLVLFFWIARRFIPLGATPEPGAAPGNAAVQSSPRLVAGIVGAALALAVGPTLTAVANARAAESRVPSTFALPAGTADWHGPELTSSAWQPAFPRADAQARGEYRNGDHWVVAYINFYASQVQGREMVGYANDILGANGWQSIGQTRRSVATGSGDVPYLELTAAAPQYGRWVVGYFYAVGDRTFTGDLASKLYYGVAVLMGRPQSGVVAAAARCAGNCSDAATAVNGFMAANAGVLANTLRKGP